MYDFNPHHSSSTSILYDLILAREPTYNQKTIRLEVRVKGVSDYFLSSLAVILYFETVFRKLRIKFTAK